MAHVNSMNVGNEGIDIMSSLYYKSKDINIVKYQRINIKNKYRINRYKYKRNKEIYT